MFHQQRDILFRRTRIGVKILIGAELTRIDEDGNRDMIGTALGSSTKVMCPSCSAPMVGTSAKRAPPFRKAEEAARKAGTS
jgi:hypothetical protein